MAQLRLIVFCVLIATSLALPDDVEKCKIDDEKCLVKSSNAMLRKHVNGVEDMNLNAFDPFKINRLKISHPTGLVTIEGVTTSSSVTGFSKGVITKMRGFDKDMVEIRYRAPLLKFKGKYSAKATLIGFPIDGAGKYSLTLKNFDSIIRFNLTREQQDDKEYFKITSIKMNYKSSNDGEIDLPEMGYFINRVLNTSFGILNGAINPILSKSWVEPFLQQFSELFKTVPIDELFLQ